jgi:hypothetical protein
MYKVWGQGVQRLTDGAFIPPEPLNKHWRKYLAWKDAGGVPDPEFSPAELAARDAETAANVQRLLDIGDALPSWAAVETAIDNAASVAALRAIVKKLARVVYWQVKNSAT